MHMSSCYQVSMTTNNWRYAEKDCEQKEAHMVIFNDVKEEVFVFYSTYIKSFNSLHSAPSANQEKHHFSSDQDVLLKFDCCFQMWIGLRVISTFGLPRWTWVDGSKLTNE